MNALYNENDEFAADWIENLIRADLVAPGIVDRRSIVDLTPDDLLRHGQVHLFAGIGIWSASFRDAGIRDDDPWWSISCPCQPFSAAGQGNGFADERHLWPYAHFLIDECRPAKIAGEQVASPDGLHWLDLVSADMEGAGYAFGASDLCAAGVTIPAGEAQIGQATIEWIRGAILTCPDPFLAAELRDYAEWFSGQVGIGAPHIRQRLYWMAYAAVARSLPGSHAGIHRGEEGTGPRDAKPERHGSVGRLADADGGHAGSEWEQRGGQQRQQPQDGGLIGLGVPDSAGRPPRELAAASMGHGHSVVAAGDAGTVGHTDDAGSQGRVERRNGGDQRLAGSPSVAFWSDAEWIVCTDGQARPVEIGTFPLAHGERSRVGKLRAYGNQIVRPLAAQFILAAQEALHEIDAGMNEAAE